MIVSFRRQFFRLRSQRGQASFVTFPPPPIRTNFRGFGLYTRPEPKEYRPDSPVMVVVLPGPTRRSPAADLVTCGQTGCFPLCTRFDAARRSLEIWFVVVNDDPRSSFCDTWSDRVNATLETLCCPSAPAYPSYLGNKPSAATVRADGPPPGPQRDRGKLFRRGFGTSWRSSPITKASMYRPLQSPPRPLLAGRGGARGEHVLAPVSGISCLPRTVRKMRTGEDVFPRV